MIHQKTFIGCAVLSLAIFGAHGAFAQEAVQQEQEGTDPVLKGEIDYVEALIGAGLPDLAEDVMAATKKRWPESEAMFFALEVRSLLLLGKMEEVEKKIGSLTDRNGAKFWAAKLEQAQYLFQQGKKQECKKIYEDFFKNNAKPAKGLVEFARNARYQWGQLLLMDGRDLEAAKNYETLLGMLRPQFSEDDDFFWSTLACDTAEIYLRLASSTDKNRGQYLKPAKGLIDKLLWRQDQTLAFGRAIAMKAHYELLSGQVDKAQTVINDYMDQLQEIHAQLEKDDPLGRKGSLRMSPMPQCRYMLAEMFWKEAQAEFKKPKRDDEKIKSFLFGAKKKNGKRNGQGAFNNALNVYMRYPQSIWAPAAGRLQEQIADFAMKSYGAKIQTKESVEQRNRVIKAQFQNAHDKFAEGDYKGAIGDYKVALMNYPELPDSIIAVENMAKAYQMMIKAGKDKADEESFRIDADAIEGYLSERFAGFKDTKAMSNAGDAVLRLAANEKDFFGDEERSRRLRWDFVNNYTRHLQAPVIAVSIAGEAQKVALDEIKVVPVLPEDDEKVKAEKEALIAERNSKLEEALKWYGVVVARYKNSEMYPTALANMSACYDKLGDRAKAIEYMALYAERQDRPLKKMQAQMSLAILYQKDGLELVGKAEAEPDSPEAADWERRGSIQIIKGIKQFQSFADAAKKAMESPSVTAPEKKDYSILREGALYLAGDCWYRLKMPVAKLKMFRTRAAENLEIYVAEYPNGKYAKASYVKLSRAYAELDDMVKGRNALERLRVQFPDSTEAKKAMPQLATSLVAYASGLEDQDRRAKVLKDVEEIYREMLENKAGDYRPTDFINAGEVLVEAKNWGLASDAFSKAENAAGTNQPTVVARARLGKAKSLIAQKLYFDARESLDDFMEDERMSNTMAATNACQLLILVAKEQGLVEKDAAMRKKHFGAAFGAVRKLRAYWSVKDADGNLKVPQWLLDTVDLMSSDVSLAQMEAEKRFGDEEAFEKACANASSKLQTFVTSHCPTPEFPIEKYSGKAAENLEKAYSDIVVALSKMGDEHKDEVVQYARDYEKYFPNGKRLANVRTYLNEALAKGAKDTAGEGTESTQQKVESAAEEGEAKVEAQAEEGEAKIEPAAEEGEAKVEAAAEPVPTDGASDTETE